MHWKMVSHCVVYSGESYIGIGNAFNENSVYILMNLPCSMRITPSVSYAGNLLLRSGSTDLSISNLDIWGSLTGNCITLNASVTGANVGDKYMLFACAGSKLILSSDL